MLIYETWFEFDFSNTTFFWFAYFYNRDDFKPNEVTSDNRDQIDDKSPQFSDEVEKVGDEQISAKGGKLNNVVEEIQNIDVAGDATAGQLFNFCICDERIFSRTNSSKISKIGRISDMLFGGEAITTFDAEIFRTKSKYSKLFNKREQFFAQHWLDQELEY